MLLTIHFVLVLSSFGLISPIKLCLTLYETSQSNRLPVFLLQLEPAAKLLTYHQKWSIASISPFQTLSLNPFVLLIQTSQKATSYIVQQHFFCVPLLQCLPAPLSFSCLIVFSCSYVAFTQGGVAKLGNWTDIIPLLSSLKCQGGVAKLGNWHVCNDWHHCSSVVLSKYCGLSIIIK